MDNISKLPSLNKLTVAVEIPRRFGNHITEELVIIVLEAEDGLRGLDLA